MGRRAFVVLALFAAVLAWLLLREGPRSGAAVQKEVLAPAPAAEMNAVASPAVPLRSEVPAEIQGKAGQGDIALEPSRFAAPLGRVVVEVTDRSGAGIEAALVSIAGPDEPALELFADFEPRAQIAREATTDAEGRAEFADLPHGRWSVRADHAGEFALARIGLDSSDAIVRMTLVPLRTLSFRVEDPSGAPVAGASVRLTGAGGGWDPGSPADVDETAVSDAEGLVAFGETRLAGYVVVASTADGRMGSRTCWT
jgi:hypothetical protein